MPWPYRFVTLDGDELRLRRTLLDRYGLYAQLSALVPIAVYWLYRLGRWVYGERQRAKIGYEVVGSAAGGARTQRGSRKKAMEVRWRKTKWWLESDVPWLGGKRGQWIAAVSWTVWLLFLSVHRTGDDYLHFTKRLGLLATSQLPLHYLLSTRTLTPLILPSHVTLTIHQSLGRIIIFLLVLHALFYLNFFYFTSLLITKLFYTTIVIWGELAFIFMALLSATSIPSVRAYSYRLFFITHVLASISIIPLMFFHAPSARFYITEALAIFVLDLGARKLNTHTALSRISPISNTNLLKLTVPVPKNKAGKFAKVPAKWVCLSIPAESRKGNGLGGLVHEMCFNPFTIAGVDAERKEITLVARALNGPTTKRFKELGELGKARWPVDVEGPYGNKRVWKEVRACERVLLVAGGVGGTYCLPIYRALRERMTESGEGEGEGTDCAGVVKGDGFAEKVTFVWAVREAEETSWAFEMGSAKNDRLQGPRSKGSSSSSSSGLNVDENGSRSRNNGRTASPSNANNEGGKKRNASEAEGREGIRFYVTESRVGNEQPRDVPDGSVEMEQLLRSEETVLPLHGGGRPDLRGIVDEVFGKGEGGNGGNEEKVAVVVCGPTGMAKELRGHVGRWVGRGREVFWHDEGFGV